MLFEVRDRVEGENTPETDLKRHHQGLEERGLWESSALRFVKLFSGLPQMDIYSL